MPIILLTLEYLIVFIALPVIYYQGVIPLWILPSLWLWTIPFAYYLYKDPTFSKSQLWGFERTRGHYKFMWAMIGLSVIALIGLLWFLEPELLFLVIQKKPLLWLIGIFAYPLISVYPQEIIYRAYFFQRYERHIKNEYLLIFLSAFAFSFMHIVFKNWYAVIFTFPGGIMFARSWLKTRSMALPWIEHSLYGQILFTIGYGTYFVKDYKIIISN